MKAALAVDRRHVGRQSARIGRWPRLWQFASEYLLALPCGAIVAFAWANADAETYYRFVHATAFMINDVAMVLFFALITKEIVEAAAPGGPGG